MILETLAMPQTTSLDLATYAAGLAIYVREYRGDYVRNAWLSGFSTPSNGRRATP